jgi:adenine-specific DNA-methyltransferase
VPQFRHRALDRGEDQPFDPPQSGKIAVKVINHFGDEVLKVYPVPATAKAR